MEVFVIAQQELLKILQINNVNALEVNILIIQEYVNHATLHVKPVLMQQNLVA